MCINGNHLGKHGVIDAIVNTVVKVQLNEYPQNPIFVARSCVVAVLVIITTLQYLQVQAQGYRTA